MKRKVNYAKLVNNNKRKLVDKIIELDSSYENILLRNSSWGYEYEYWKIYELKELIEELKQAKV